VHTECWIPEEVIRAIVSTYWDPDGHGVHTTVPPQQKPVKRFTKMVRAGRQKIEKHNKKGSQCKSGMVGPQASKTDKNKDGEVNNKQVIHCSHCKSDTHKCRMSKSCALNTKNLAAKEKLLFRNANFQELIIIITD
jgi:hypothetical protein